MDPFSCVFPAALAHSGISEKCLEGLCFEEEPSSLCTGIHLFTHKGRRNMLRCSSLPGVGPLPRPGAPGSVLSCSAGEADSLSLLRRVPRVPAGHLPPPVARVPSFSKRTDGPVTPSLERGSEGLRLVVASVIWILAGLVESPGAPCHVPSCGTSGAGSRPFTAWSPLQRRRPTPWT